MKMGSRPLVCKTKSNSISSIHHGALVPPSPPTMSVLAKSEHAVQVLSQFKTIEGSGIHNGVEYTFHLTKKAWFATYEVAISFFRNCKVLKCHVDLSFLKTASTSFWTLPFKVGTHKWYVKGQTFPYYLFH